MLRPSRDTSVTGLAAIMREGVVIVFCFVCSTVIGWNWHKLLSVSHTPLRSFRNNVQRVYTQQRWWISQLARFRPRNRVWTWTLRAKTGERETYRKMAIDQTHGEVIPEITFPSFCSGRFLFIFQCERCQLRPGAWHNISTWLMICRVSPVIVFLKNSYGCRWLHIKFPSHPPIPPLPVLAADVPWRFLPFIKPLFPLPGLWRDWKGELGEEGKC